MHRIVALARPSILKTGTACLRAGAFAGSIRACKVSGATLGYWSLQSRRMGSATASTVQSPRPNPYANARPLTDDEIAVIKSTVPVLAEHGLTLTTKFYGRMLAAHPELKNIFNSAHQATGMQPKALASAVYAYAANITNLGALSGAVAHITHRHASLSILPEHYPIVGEHLLATLKELLTGAGMPADTITKIIDAWAVAYAQLSNILISTEEQLYQAAASVPGGWRGWRKFTVVKRVAETDSASGAAIVSFTLKPSDGGLVPSYLPGQFTTVRAVLEEQKTGQYVQPRQYSLTAPTDSRTFSIAVKREDAAKPPAPYTNAGVVSSWVHTQLQEGKEVELAPPFGDFVLKPGTSPVVLLGAGVGITPLSSMLEAAVKTDRPVSLLYAARSGAHHPLKEWFGKHKKNLPVRVWYSEPGASDKLGATYDEKGFVDLSRLPADQAKKLVPAGAQVYICGPLPFMQAQLAALRRLGFKEDQLHAEIFGSGTL